MRINSYSPDPLVEMTSCNFFFEKARIRLYFTIKKLTFRGVC